MSEDPYDKISEHYAEGLRKSMETCLTGFNIMMDNAQKLINEQAEERIREDKELLELAAKAAGIAWHKEYLAYLDDDGDRWSPLVRDDHALRLAVKLGISLTPYPIYQHENRHSVIAKQRRETDTLREINPTEMVEVYKDDPYAATRRSIVRAAAEIGRSMG